MTVGATRHFESSYATVEWLLEEREDDLSDSEIEALVTYHEVLRRVSNDLWDVEPPKLPEKNDDVPLPDSMGPEYFQEHY